MIKSPPLCRCKVVRGVKLLVVDKTLCYCEVVCKENCLIWKHVAASLQYGPSLRFSEMTFWINNSQCLGLMEADNSLEVESLLELLDEERLRKDTALPSPEWSSDHIALLAEFRCKIHLCHFDSSPFHHSMCSCQWIHTWGGVLDQLLECFMSTNKEWHLLCLPSSNLYAASCVGFQDWLEMCMHGFRA
jgi:hypothetical protein